MSDSCYLSWDRKPQSSLLEEDTLCFDELENLAVAEMDSVDVPLSGSAETANFLVALITEVRNRFESVTMREVFQREIASINNRITHLERAASICVSIQTLAPEPLQLMKPIQATVWFSDGEYYASFFDANISTSGDSQSEAVLNLKDLLIGTYELLMDADNSNLGPGPLHQKAVLREFISKL